MNVLVVGGTGMLGRRIVRRFLGRGDDVIVASRAARPAGLPAGVRTVQWDTRSPFPLREPVDVVVATAGASIIGNRWSEAYKREMWRSRVELNEHLAAWCRQMQPPPRVFVTSNAVGYYGVAPAVPVTEDAAPGDDFLARLCVAWEKAALGASTDATRVVSLRQGVVIDKESDALKKVVPIFKLGIGGKVGSGRQPFPWISSHDLARLVETVVEDQNFRGPMNAVTPGPDTNLDFTRALGRALSRPTLFPVPPFALRVLYGEAAQVMTAGQKVVPARAKALGFTWDHPTLDVALRWAITNGGQDLPPPRLERERVA